MVSTSDSESEGLGSIPNRTNTFKKSIGKSFLFLFALFFLKRVVLMV